MVNLSIVTSGGGRINPAIREGNERHILRTITNQLVTAAIWRRQLPDLDAWLHAHLRSFLEVGLIARPKVLRDELSQAADAAGICDSIERRLFLTDVCELAHDFAGIAGVPNVDVRLKVTTEASLCAEALPEDGMRLLTVYHLASSGHARSASEPTSVDWEVSNNGTALELERSSVVILKGRRSPGRRREIARSKPCDRVELCRALYLLEVRP